MDFVLGRVGRLGPRSRTWYFVYSDMTKVPGRSPADGDFQTEMATFAFLDDSPHAAWVMAVFQLPFIINIFWSLFKGKQEEENPWRATTLEWATPTPPPHGNFLKTPEVFRGPYEYSVPQAAQDYSPQHEEKIV